MNRLEAQPRSILRLRRPLEMKTSLLVLGLLFSLDLCGPLFAQETYSAKSFESVDQSLHKKDAEIYELRQRIDRLEEVLEGQVLDRKFVGPFISNTIAEGHCETCDELREIQFPTIEVNGFLQFDTALFGESAATKRAYGDIADSTAVRRARLAVSGDVYTDVGYKLDVDFAASGHPSFRDMILEFREQAYADRFVIGFFKAPFQLDALTSSKDFTFAERAPFFTFAPFRQIGIGANGAFANEMATWSIVGFRTGTDGFAVAQSDDGYGLAARSTFLLWYVNEGRGLLHIGLNYNVEQPNGKVVRYDAKLGFFVDEEPGGSTTDIPAIVDTGLIATDGANILNFELVGTHGRLHF